MAQGKSGNKTHKGTHHSKRRRKMNKRNRMVLMRWIAVAAALLVVVLIGMRCTNGGDSKGTTKERVEVDETASRVQFSKKGAVTVTSVESFDKDYYDQTELQEAIDSEVASYNDTNGGGVNAGDLTVENGTATLVMKYDSAADYEAFNDQDMFWGTLQEAEDAGYDLSRFSGQTNAQNSEETFGEGTAMTLAENPVIVITEPLNILTATDILYASSNLKIANSDYAMANGDVNESTPAILILDK